MKHQPITIETAGMEDIPEIRTLIPVSVRGLSRQYYDTDQIEGAIKDIFGVDTQLIEDKTYFTARAHKILVGCGGWSRRRTLYGGDKRKTGADDLLNSATDAARIRAFFIHPEWARQGIGSDMMKICEKKALEEGFGRLQLVSTLPGEPLYRSFGFEEEERYEVDLSNGTKIPVVRMMKKIGK